MKAKWDPLVSKDQLDWQDLKVLVVHTELVVLRENRENLEIWEQ